MSAVIIKLMRRWGWLFLLLLAALACGSPEEKNFEQSQYHAAPPTELVFVEAGSFTMGSDYHPGLDIGTGDVDEPFSDEHPEYLVQLNAYSIEKTEVSNVQYRACVHDGACVDPHNAGNLGISDYYTAAAFEDYPVANVTRLMARDYCEWRGRRLPTEAEWEKAARGTADDRTYPWGWAEPTCGLANISIILMRDDEWQETCSGFPVPTGAYASSASPFGIRGMTGNVAEWVSDYYAADYYQAAGSGDNPQGPSSGDQRVVRGGGFTSTALFARVSYRDHRAPEYYDPTVGFRCAKDGE